MRRLRFAGDETIESLVERSREVAASGNGEPEEMGEEDGGRVRVFATSVRAESKLDARDLELLQKEGIFREGPVQVAQQSGSAHEKLQRREPSGRGGGRRSLLVLISSSGGSSLRADSRTC